MFSSEWLTSDVRMRQQIWMDENHLILSFLLTIVSNGNKTLFLLCKGTASSAPILKIYER